MSMRKPFLSDGWYPHDAESAERDLNDYVSSARDNGYVPESAACAAVAPHASWFYSGKLAAAAFLSLDEKAQTVVVCGGHLSDRSEALMAPDDSFFTPFGALPADLELAAALSSRFSFFEDRVPDNTVEIQLPLVKRFFPESQVLWLRMPASMRAYEIGRALHAAAQELSRKVVVVGSTDLTHYGPNYDFMSHGQGAAALSWVRETNDKRFIGALLEGDAEKAISRALSEGSACSPGGAAAALGFAQASGAANGRLLGYATSADVSPASSFVGYAALSWSRT